MPQVRILLVQLGANGDCLFVTTIAKQIKEVDYPGCHLTWMIGSLYKQVILNNPYIDSIIEIPISKKEDLWHERTRIDVHIAEATGSAKFDKIIVTDYCEKNEIYWFGTTRASLFRSYPFQLQVSPKPVMYLTESEKRNVANFCDKNKLTKSGSNILFECSPQSGQSNITFDNALVIATHLVKKYKRLRIILSSNISFQSKHQRIIDGSELSWRENAFLTHYCQLMIGCSSGISWLATSNASNEIPMVQVINPDYMSGKISASMKSDMTYFHLPTTNLIELYNPTTKTLFACICNIISIGFQNSKSMYDGVKEDGELVDAANELKNSGYLAKLYTRSSAYLKAKAAAIFKL